MTRTRTIKSKQTATKSSSNGLKMRGARKTDPDVHIFGNGIVCDTDTRGHATPDGKSVLELVVTVSEGFIPLWAKGTTLRWRFQEHSLHAFESPAAAKTAIRKLLGKALLAWGDATPVKFSEQNDAWDFEIAVRDTDRCNINGCVLASAFFPDSGRHELKIYPKLFEQSMEEQVETLIHEIGHTFGLRHFFAQIKETEVPSLIFGAHTKFTIMNYGPDSKLTAQDKSDLKRLYQQVWDGQLTEINGTPIRLFTPFHTTGAHPDSVVAVGQVQASIQPQAMPTSQAA